MFIRGRALSLLTILTGLFAWTNPVSGQSAGQTAISDAAYPLLTERVTAVQNNFIVYDNADSGFNHWLAYLAGRRGDMARAVELLQPCFEFGTDTHDTRVLFHCTNVVIWLLAERGDPERMARLVGAQRALLHRTGFTPGTWAHTRSADAGASIEARPTPEGFDAALTTGRQLYDKEVATLAVSVLTSEADLKGRPAAHDHQRLPSLLSVREQEVLQLVAEGLPNKGIAQRLIIAPTTVNYHLTSIFNKLGVNTRAQAVAAAAQRHLL